MMKIFIGHEITLKCMQIQTKSLTKLGITCNTWG